MTMAIATTRKQITASVFPPASFTTPGRPALQIHGHSYNTRHHSAASPVRENVPSPMIVLPGSSSYPDRTSQAWHTATAFLSFQEAPFPNCAEIWIETQPNASKNVREAIYYFIGGNEDSNIEENFNLFNWYIGVVRRHFLTWVKPQIAIPPRYENPVEVLGDILNCLATARTIYLYRLLQNLLDPGFEDSLRKTSRRSKGRKVRKLPVEHDSGTEYNDPRVQSFLHSFNTLISHSLPDPAWCELVHAVLLNLFGHAIGLHQTSAADVVVTDDKNTFTIAASSSSMKDDTPYTKNKTGIMSPRELGAISGFESSRGRKRLSKVEARRKVLELWRAMEKLGVGGGGRRGEMVFAEAINSLITTYIHRRFAGVWTSPSEVGHNLNNWIETELGDIVMDVLFSGQDKVCNTRNMNKLSPRENVRAVRQDREKISKGGMETDHGPALDEEEKKRRKDVEKWKIIATGRLGRLRVNELFDIIVEWPDSLGGIEDLKSYVTDPQTRLHLCNTLTETLSNRLLHPAAGTADILRAYVKLIRALAFLDPRGVILDRVSRGIRRYLRERDDTVRVTVRGIMADFTENPDEDLSDLSEELSKGIPALVAISGGLEDLDYDDMRWMPDPVDAGPEFQRFKGLDVVGLLFSLWESKEAWVKEIQHVLSMRLLQNSKYDFNEEFKAIELLKVRFGDAALQCCDVMLKDMADSKRAAAVIKEMVAATGCYQGNSLNLEVKVLSRLFWPARREGAFCIPTEIQKLMEIFAQGFEKLSKNRKLDWEFTAGMVDIELELEDRIVSIPNATPAQAAAINVFDSVDCLRIDELVQLLEMDEKTVKSVLTFWVEKEVLFENKPGVFYVMETLDKSDTRYQDAAPLQYLEDEENISQEKQKQRTIIEQFVLGMLTNGGATSTERIGVMLHMLVPGFTWSNDELATFLCELKDIRKLDLVNGAWGVL